jgi:hypothetical protein
MKETIIFPLLLCSVVACGDVNTDDPDATDDPTIDVPVETTTDTTPDAVPDGTVDAAPEPDPDVGLDPLEDASPDTSSDLPGDWPTDHPEEWPYPVSGQCEDHGGFCSGGSELLCPWGYEPIERRPHGNCINDGWCCTVAPYSECTASGEANCFEGTTCTAVDGCLGDPTTAYACETGRVCCVDVCG